MTKPKLMFVDRGLFVNFAVKLSKWFTVFYFCHWSGQAFPGPNAAFIGDGMEEIERVKDFWAFVPQMDYLFFADIYDGGLQEHLRSLGCKVFGQGRGDELEIYRWKTRKLMAEVGLPVNPAERVIGMKALREYLKEHEDVFVKISGYRGLVETFHSLKYDTIDVLLDDIQNSLGGLAKIFPFIIESKIDAVVEVGYDGYSIDGQYPDSALCGVEVKDCGYIGRFMAYDKLPKSVKFVNKKLAKLLKHSQYRMFFSTEIRETEDGTPYLIDLTMRLPSPPSELYQELYGNLDQIIMAGAEGVLVQPEAVKKYGVSATIFSAFCEDHWNKIHIDDRAKPWVKLHNQCRIEGIDNIVPSTIRMPEIGQVVGIGDTLLEAIKHCRENAGLIEGYDIKVKTDSLIDGIEALRGADEHGIKICDEELPTVDQILAA